MTAKGENSFRDIAGVLIRFSLPLILSGILQQLYNWADAFIVGNVEGEAALAAVGATTIVVYFYVMVITGFTLGLAVLFAQKYGGGQLSAIPKILSTFSLVVGVFFTLVAGLGIWLVSPLLNLLNTTADTILLAEEYLRLVLLGVPFLAVYNVYSAALRGIGDSKAPFYSVLLSSVVNVLLDILLVAVLRWGVAGAAVATAVSQAAMTAFLVVYSIRKYDILRFGRGGRLIDYEMLAEGCRLGFPPMIQSGVSSAGSLILQNFMNGFGTQTVAAITTAYRVDSIVMVPIINLGSGISTLVAQSFGGGDMRRARKILGVGSVVMIVVSLLLTVLVIPTGGKLIAFFGAGEAAAAIGDSFFRRIAVFYVVFGLATAARSYLEGIGDVLYSGVAGISSLVFRIIFSYAVVGVFANMVIAFAEGFSWVWLLLMFLIRMVWMKRRI